MARLQLFFLVCVLLQDLSSRCLAFNSRFHCKKVRSFFLGASDENQSGDSLLQRLKRKKLRKVVQTKRESVETKEKSDVYLDRNSVPSFENVDSYSQQPIKTNPNTEIRFEEEESNNYESEIDEQAFEFDIDSEGNVSVDPLEDILEEGEAYLSVNSRSERGDYEPTAPILRSRNSQDSGSSFGSTFNHEVVYDLLRQRFFARYHKDYEKADQIRDQLEFEYGVQIYDRKGFWRASSGESGSLKGYHEEFLDKVYPVAPVECTFSRDEIERKVHLRTQLRRAHNYEHADAIRDELAKAGVELMDKSNEWRTFDGKMGGSQSDDR